MYRWLMSRNASGVMLSYPWGKVMDSTLLKSTRKVVNVVTLLIRQRKIESRHA
jgi:hypothetical protein